MVRRIDSETIDRAMAWVKAGGDRPPSPTAFSDTLQLVDDPGDRAVELTLPVCRAFEGLALRPYLDAAGVATIGYGSTIYPDGRVVTLRDAPITQAQAERYMRHHLQHRTIPAVRRLCPGVDHPGRLAALLDWTYNLGAGNLAASTLRKRVNADDWDAVPGELRRWVYAGGKRLRGLVRRREAEIALLAVV